ncbi:hypothetical protein AAFN47_18680 [Hoeflea sp. CAU 1731]
MVIPAWEMGGNEGSNRVWEVTGHYRVRSAAVEGICILGWI